MVFDRDIWVIAKSLLTELGLDPALELCAERIAALTDNTIGLAGWKQIESATLMLADTTPDGHAIH